MEKNRDSNIRAGKNFRLPKLPARVETRNSGISMASALLKAFMSRSLSWEGVEPSRRKYVFPFTHFTSSSVAKNGKGMLKSIVMRKVLMKKDELFTPT